MNCRIRPAIWQHRLVSFSIRSLEPTAPEWRELAATGSGATSYHNPDLVVAASTAFGKENLGWGVWGGGELLGGLLMQRRAGGAIGPSPVVPFNGPVIRPSSSPYRSVRDRHDSRVLASLFDAVSSEAPTSRIRMSTEISDIREALSRGWAVGSSFSYVMDISDLESTWKEMDPNRRRLIRRAESNGYVVTSLSSLGPDPDRLVAEMIELQRRQMSPYGERPRANVSTWRTLCEGVIGTGSGRLFVACSPDGSPVAFQLTAVWRDLAGNMITGSDPEHAALGANSLLRWRVCELLHAEGVSRIDLNGARSGEAGRFKASLGAEISERWDLWRPDGVPLRTLFSRFVTRVRRNGLGNPIAARRPTHDKT